MPQVNVALELSDSASEINQDLSRLSQHFLLSPKIGQRESSPTDGSSVTAVDNKGTQHDVEDDIALARRRNTTHRLAQPQILIGSILLVTEAKPDELVTKLFRNYDEVTHMHTYNIQAIIGFGTGVPEKSVISPKVVVSAWSDGEDEPEVCQTFPYNKVSFELCNRDMILCLFDILGSREQNQNVSDRLLEWVKVIRATPLPELSISDGHWQPEFSRHTPSGSIAPVISPRQGAPREPQTPRADRRGPRFWSSSPSKQESVSSKYST